MKHSCRYRSHKGNGSGLEAQGLLIAAGGKAQAVLPEEGDEGCERKKKREWFGPLSLIPQGP